MMDVAVGTINGVVTLSVKVNVPTSPDASLTVPAARYVPLAKAPLVVTRPLGLTISAGIPLV